jgi:hypothetical protein
MAEGTCFNGDEGTVCLLSLVTGGERVLNFNTQNCESTCDILTGQQTLLEEDGNSLRKLRERVALGHLLRKDESISF